LYSVKHIALHSRGIALVATIAALLSLSACGDKQPPVDSSEAEEPPAVTATDKVAEAEAAVPENPLKNAYFGETHVHTSFSMDAFIGGGRLSPSDAYRFAKGEDVTLNNQLHNIVKPLDFAAVSDHAEFIGEMYSTQVSSAPGHYQPALDELRTCVRRNRGIRRFTRVRKLRSRRGKTSSSRPLKTTMSPVFLPR
jgi:hypothetical protein